MSTSPPKVFISHSSLDKDRFVRDVAERLTQDGVDVWFDEWSLNPGDSLIKKIFDEGLAQTDVVIAVLSDHSADSAWVSQELDVATIAMINRVCRVIPVLIDQVTVPVAFSALVYQPIPNTEGYDAEYRRLLSSIYNVSAKPELGEPPAYVISAPDESDLPAQAAALLDVLGEQCFSLDQRQLTDSAALSGSIAELELSNEDVVREFARLKKLGFVQSVSVQPAGHIEHVSLDHTGVLEAYRLAGNGLAGTTKAVIAAIVNGQLRDVGAIAAEAELPGPVVDAVCDRLEEQQMLKMSRAMGRRYFSYRLSNVSPLVGELLEGSTGVDEANPLT